MVRACLLSSLARQQSMLQERMLERYPHCWLAWEPGTWTEPPSADTATTRQPTPPPPVGRPSLVDALCFELAPRADHLPLRLGRAPGNDVIVNDATVSREHLLLTKSEAGWAAEVAGHAKATFLGSAPLLPGQRIGLADRQQIRLGNVVFTFHEPGSFIQRLCGSAAGLR
jgi:hypothetical protein